MRFINYAMFCLLLGSPSWCHSQQNPNGMISLSNVEQPYLFLVRDPVVHNDLNLSTEQLRKVQAINDRIDESIWTTNNKRPEDRVAILRKAMTDTRREFSAVLSNEQVQRISQIELWVLGMKSLLRNDVATKMELNENQRSEVPQIIRTAQQKISELRKQLNEGGDATELNRQYRETATKQQQDIIALLTPEQKQTWVGILGKRVDVAKLGRIKFKAPDLHAASGWVNSEPLTLDKLKGKVVALHFYAFA